MTIHQREKIFKEKHENKMKIVKRMPPCFFEFSTRNTTCVLYRYVEALEKPRSSLAGMFSLREEIYFKVKNPNYFGGT